MRMSFSYAYTENLSLPLRFLEFLIAVDFFEFFSFFIVLPNFCVLVFIVVVIQIVQNDVIVRIFVNLKKQAVESRNICFHFAEREVCEDTRSAP